MIKPSRTPKSPQVDEQLLTSKPKPIVVKSLVELSSSDNYEEAREEWELLGAIEPESVDFEGHCELCGTMLHKINWEINNTITSNRIKVGSSCIKRFLLLAGTGSQEATIQYMDNMEKEWGYIKDLRLTYNDIIKNPAPLKRSLGQFYKKLTTVLERRGIFPLKPDFELGDLKPILKDIFAIHELPPVKERWKLYQVLYDPSKIPTTKENKKFTNPKFKEGDTFKKKRVTSTTLSRSSAYRNPANKYK